MITQRSCLADIVKEFSSSRTDYLSYVCELCDWIDAKEALVKALLPEENRRERLLREASALSSRFPRPSDRPPLYGALVGIKDVFHVDGFVTRAGSRLPPTLFAGPEAACVQSLRRLGALILGKTVTTEFAFFEPGPTRNPVNLAHTPGGSSSGSAAAVAAGFCPLAVGTQSIGSVIRPAAFCGIVGFKPSYHRISREGLIPFSDSADHVGLFTQDATSMKLAASLLCNEWRDDESRLDPHVLPTLAVPEGPYLEQASEEALAIFKVQLAKLKDAGCSLRHMEAFRDIAAIARRHRSMIAAELAKVHREWFRKYRPLYRPLTSALIEEGQRVSAEELAAARAGRERLRIELKGLIRKAGADLWITPATVSAAPRTRRNTGDPAMNLPWTHAGLPALAIPAGHAGNELPLGVQLAANFRKDEKLLGWATILEDLLRE